MDKVSQLSTIMAKSIEILPEKDKVRPPQSQYVDLILDNQNSGHWIRYCRMAAALKLGMMFGFNVEPKGGT